MTIQKTVLFGLTFLTLIPAASAQCRRSSMPAFHDSNSVQQVTRYQKFAVVQQQIPVRQEIHVAHPPIAVVSCQAGQCSPLTELAGRFETLMHEACLDLFYNYGHEVHFKATYGDVYRLFQIARQLHNAQGISEHALQQQLAEADGLLHHIQSTVSSMSAVRRRQVGIYDMGARLEQIELVLHQILQDTGVTVNHGLEEPPTPEALSGVQQRPAASVQPLAFAPDPPVAPPAPATPGLPQDLPESGEVSFAPEAPAAAGVN